MRLVAERKSGKAGGNGRKAGRGHLVPAKEWAVCKEAAGRLGELPPPFIAALFERIADDDGLLQESAAQISLNRLVGNVDRDVEGLTAVGSSALERRSILKQARKYYKTNDMIQWLTDRRAELTSDGFHLHLSDPDVVDRYADLNRRVNMDAIADDLARDLFTYDSALLVWQMDEDRIKWCQTIDPADIDYQYAFGSEQIWVTVPKAMLEKKADDAKRAKKKKRRARYEPSISVSAGTKRINLIDQEGVSWILFSRGRKGLALLPVPKMVAIFEILNLRTALMRGDFSVAYLIKNLITLITDGDKGSATRPPQKLSKKLKQQILKEFTSGTGSAGKAMIVVGNATMDIKHIIPDMTVFDPKKYTGTEAWIMRWAGIGLQIAEGKGGSWSSGHINVSALKTQCRQVRKIIKRGLEFFYNHDDIRRAAKVAPDAEGPAVVFNENSFKDPAQLLDEVTGLYESGLLSFETSLSELQRHPEVELARKKREWADLLDIIPKFERGQGLQAALIMVALHDKVKEGEMSEEDYDIVRSFFLARKSEVAVSVPGEPGAPKVATSPKPKTGGQPRPGGEGE